MPRNRQKFMAEQIMKVENVTYEEARRRIADSLPAKRFGLPEEFGDACAFLCSAQAGFITGQNLQLDGGSYEARNRRRRRCAVFRPRLSA